MKALDAAVGVREIKALAELKDDWDTYGSPPPSAAALQTAFGLLTVLEGVPFGLPHVAPVPGGGVQIEWHIGSEDIELEIACDGHVTYP